MQKFYLYARKSTDVEERQVMSIEAQLTELRAFAKKEGIWIAETIIEKRTAKIPGRPLFTGMLDRIEKEEASGIISWHPDRLARNSVDGGRIIYLLDTGQLTALKFPQFWYENTPQGKFMLNMAFGQSKYYVDSLAENVKRGLRQKVRNGIYPALAPVGYINDVRRKTVVVDKKRSLLIRQAFELYAQGNSCLEDVADFLARNGVLSRDRNPLRRDRITYILSNPFYYGHFKYAKEVYAGKHQPIVPKNIFDQVQMILKQKGRPRSGALNAPQALCGLIQCESCGMMITGEYRVKRQKNGNEHHYTYYHCSKRGKAMDCPEPCIRAEALDEQLSSLIQKYSLPKDWALQLLEMVEKDEKDGTQSSVAFVQDAKRKISDISAKLQRLLDSYLEEDIEREIYLAKKAELMSEKKTLEEQMIHFEQTQIGWFEPMREWIKEAQNIGAIAGTDDLFAKRVIAKKLFGSNLRLGGNRLEFQSITEGGNIRKDWGETQWTALVAAHENFLRSPENDSCIVIMGRQGFEPWKA